VLFANRGVIAFLLAKEKPAATMGAVASAGLVAVTMFATVVVTVLLLKVARTACVRSEKICRRSAIRALPKYVRCTAFAAMFYGFRNA
jgi:hypothetical protein